MATAWIGIGSNLGERELTIRRAVDALDARPDVDVARVSPLLETEPVGGPADQPMFLNGAAELRTTLEPQPLVDALHAVEDRLGRHRAERWGPRVIDLDLLLYGERIVSSGRLMVPHPQVRRRRFVLEPLAAIAPEAIDPVTGLTVCELLERLRD